jgi:hypothetical protein
MVSLAWAAGARATASNGANANAREREVFIGKLGREGGGAKAGFR